jgi:hypothetical protein
MLGKDTDNINRKILWNVDPLLDNDGEMINYAKAVAK